MSHLVGVSTGYINQTLNFNIQVISPKKEMLYFVLLLIVASAQSLPTSENFNLGEDASIPIRLLELTYGPRDVTEARIRKGTRRIEHVEKIFKNNSPNPLHPKLEFSFPTQDKLTLTTKQKMPNQFYVDSASFNQWEVRPRLTELMVGLKLNPKNNPLELETLSEKNQILAITAKKFDNKFSETINVPPMTQVTFAAYTLPNSMRLDVGATFEVPSITDLHFLAKLLENVPNTPIGTTPQGTVTFTLSAEILALEGSKMGTNEWPKDLEPEQ